MPYDFPSYISDNNDFLKKLSKTKSEKRKNKFISKASKDQILTLVEIIANILKGNFPLKKNKRVKLSKSADYYRSVSRSRSERTARKRLQTGGQIGALAAILSPVIGAIAQHFLDKSLKSLNQNEAH